MTAFCWRELGSVARSRALAASIGVHVSVLVAFLLLWGEGMPMLPGANVYEQLVVVQHALLALLLPWTAVRCAVAAGGNELVMLAAAAATPPSRVLLGQGAGRFAALVAVVIVSVPPMIVAQQASALPLVRIAWDVLAFLGLCAAASLFTSWSMLVCRSRIAAWLWASGLVAATVSIASPAGFAGMWLLAAFAAIGAAALAVRADTRCRYLSDEALSA